MPPERPLDMPAQSLRALVGGRGAQAGRRAAALADALARARFSSSAAPSLLTAYGAYEMYQVVSVSRTTVLQWLLLALFTINFSWIAVAFTSALLGFVVLLGSRDAAGRALPRRLESRTAVVMPVYNEQTARTFAALEAIRESVEATGLGGAFRLFHPLRFDRSRRLDRRGARLPRRCASASARTRASTTATGPRTITARPATSPISCSRWGGHYEHMLVLDADSLMTGDCIVRLAAAMEADPDAGIIQTLPLIINRNTLFARLQQFAARVYGPVIATGLSAWMGRDGNYWGHNAIIRTSAFAAHAGLPDLKGKPPLGGHILSHDFVEAALIRRAGWTVYMLPDLEGSYEESPPSLIDLAARDRRWCQGNLQHTRVIGAKGLKLPTRQHFATGIMSYLASPFWLFQLIVGIALVLQTTYIRPEYFSPRLPPLPGLAAVRPRARAGAVRRSPWGSCWRRSSSASSSC